MNHGTIWALLMQKKTPSKISCLGTFKSHISMVVQKSVRRSGISDSPESERRGVPESCLHWSQTLPKCPEVRKPRFWICLQDSNSRILFQMGRKETPAAPIRSQKRDSRSCLRWHGKELLLLLLDHSDHEERSSCNFHWSEELEFLILK